MTLVSGTESATGKALSSSKNPAPVEKIKDMKWFIALVWGTFYVFVFAFAFHLKSFQTQFEKQIKPILFSSS